jgi:hypothetical protein
VLGQFVTREIFYYNILVRTVEISVVELVETDITIFRARGEVEAVGGDGDGVDGTEVAVDGGEVLLVVDVPEVNLEVTFGST